MESPYWMTERALKQIWHQMRYRCERPKTRNYRYYGGRGIRVCDRWQNFENFKSDMGPRPSAQHTLERVDVNGNYEPDNCKWATYEEQALNKRHGPTVESQAVIQSLLEI